MQIGGATSAVLPLLRINSRSLFLNTEEHLTSSLLLSQPRTVLSMALTMVMGKYKKVDSRQHLGQVIIATAVFSSTVSNEHQAPKWSIKVECVNLETREYKSKQAVFKRARFKSFSIVIYKCCFEAFEALGPRYLPDCLLLYQPIHLLRS